MSRTPKKSRIVFHGAHQHVGHITDNIHLNAHGRGGISSHTTPAALTPRKRKRGISPEPSPPPVRDGPEVASDVEPAEPVPPRLGPNRKIKNGISVILARWKPLFPSLLDDLLDGEVDEDIPGSCGCGQPATARCRDCFVGRAYCNLCIVKEHTHLPFHWVELWNGAFFVKTDLSALGLIFYLGHRGIACPHIPTGSVPSRQVTTHTNGVHLINIHYCHCPRCPPRLSQLVRAGIFPATITSPESGFTIQLLKEWHIHFLTSKKGAYDYMRALCRLTDNSAPQTVKDRYREFNVVARIWAHLCMVKRSGNHISLVLPNRDPTLLTVPCFACPWPGLNMPDNWQKTPLDLQYIHGCELGGDGNHGLQKKSKHDDPDDSSLAPGQGYFVTSSQLSAYLASNDMEAVPETCSGFKVGRAQRPGKFRNLEVSGVVAVICIRHGCFRPRAMVDLQKGERYGHMDFALAGALDGLQELKQLIFTYDVACIYSVHLRRRFQERFPHLVPLLDRIRLLLPKLHMLAHKELCQVFYALCYTPGAGLSHGESVEHPWAEHNQAGLSTREMSAGHRHDVLNDLHNFWNWLKVEGLASFLARKLAEALKGQEKKTAYFNALSKSAGSALVSKWEKMDTTCIVNGKKVESVYMLDESKVPSVGKVFQELSKLEIGATDALTKEATRVLPLGTAGFLQTALRIEKSQAHIRARIEKSPSGDDDSDDVILSLENERRTLRREITAWRVSQKTFMPDVELPEDNLADEEDDCHGMPEVEPLALPSDFSDAERSGLGLQSLGDCELQMRIGHAYDIINAIKDSIRHRSAFINDKRKHARGQKDNTRAQTKIKTAAANTRTLAQAYNDNHKHLINLGMKESETGLQKIDLNADLAAKNLHVPRSLGDSKEERAWIWSLVPPGATERDVHAWSTEVERVEWFRARADKARHDEEVNKLHEEFRRAIRTFHGLAAAWTAASTRAGISRGGAAYAQKKAAMFSLKGVQCDNSFRKTRTDPDGNKLDYTLQVEPDVEPSSAPNTASQMGTGTTPTPVAQKAKSAPTAAQGSTPVAQKAKSALTAAQSSTPVAQKAKSALTAAQTSQPVEKKWSKSGASPTVNQDLPLGGPRAASNAATCATPPSITQVAKSARRSQLSRTNPSKVGTLPTINEVPPAAAETSRPRRSARFKNG